jgi:hypothetical protein
MLLLALVQISWSLLRLGMEVGLALNYGIVFAHFTFMM